MFLGEQTTVSGERRDLRLADDSDLEDGMRPRDLPPPPPPPPQRSRRLKGRKRLIAPDASPALPSSTNQQRQTRDAPPLILRKVRNPQP
ncbi:hypothetical protein TNCT_323681 [Trichonephila clavata]|uniref:Uncharacterized protein n=1 Tax=Trichonephila clavata TaxID=2740835 RepID=A0A8X6HWQ1_TRICU|nr:hypothetical protein TNCT_323681 [Trichonephila clavata]